MTKVFWATFINTALITLIVNVDLSHFWIGEILPKYVFNGEYYDTERAWYSKVGSTFTTTMLVAIASPHLVELFVKYPLGIIKRRKCAHRYKS